MPDNKHMEQQNLADRGWQRMSEILDREMPSRHRRRMVAWLPWGLGGIALLVAFGWWVTSTQLAQEARSNAPGLEQPANLSPAEEQPTHHKTNAEGASATSTAGETNPAQEEIAPAHTSQLFAETHDAKSAGHASQITSPPAYTALEIQGAEPVEGAVHSTDTEAVPDKTDYILTNKPAVTLRSESAKARDMIPERVQTGSPSRILGFVALLDVPQRTLIPAGIDAPKDSPIGLEIFGAGHISDVFEVRGVDVGLGATWDVADRLTLHAGAAFGHYQKNGLVRIGSAQADAAELSVDPSNPTQSGGGFFYDPSTEVWLGNGLAADLDQVSYDTARLLSNAFNYLHFPVSLEFHLTTRFSVSAGVQYSYLVSAPTGYDVIPDPTFSSRTTKSFLYSNDLLRKHDVAPRIGIGLRLSKNLTVDATYHHGLIPYIDESGVPDRSDFNRSLALGLRYRIL